jgi:RimJ/RimL family protein N-acetyltransferase
MRGADSSPLHLPRIRAMTPILQTSRLILRPLELADAEQAQVLFPHWEIVRYLRKIVPWPYPPDALTPIIARLSCLLSHAATNGRGRFG